MKRLILAAGGLLLATANTPPTAGGPTPDTELDSVVAAGAPKATAPAAAKPAPAKPARVAAVPVERVATYPRCSASIRDRCVQGRPAVARKRHREIQYAMRAGERG